MLWQATSSITLTRKRRPSRAYIYIRYSIQGNKNTRIQEFEYMTMETKKCYSTIEQGRPTLGTCYSTTEHRRPTLGTRYSTIEHGVSTLGTRYSTIEHGVSTLGGRYSTTEQPIFRQKARYSTTEHRIHRCDFKHEFLRSVGAQALRGVPRINHKLSLMKN